MTSTTIERQSAALHERVRRFMVSALVGSRSEDFDQLAVTIARFQMEQVEPVACLAHNRKLDAQSLTRADAIPAIPCDAFRLRRVVAHPPDQDVRCFRSSGTTLGAESRSRHPFRTTDTYTLGAIGWGQHMLWPDQEELRFIGLIPSECQAPDSSLSFMLARFAETLGGPSGWHWSADRLDVDGVVASCAAARDTAEPTLVAGTAFAFVHLSDALGKQRLPLPPGSRVMQTGGFKGQSRQVDPATLRRSVAQRFGVAESHVVGEYGMTELSSQLYQGTLRAAVRSEPAPLSDTAYVAPPWIRVTAVDPITLEPVSAGAEGLCRIVDLANVDSSVAIQTEDRIRQQPDGSIELLGRTIDAPPRGCSLAVEHLLEPTS